MPQPSPPVVRTQQQGCWQRSFSARLNISFLMIHSQADIAMAFHCNMSQLTKVVTGVDYKGGPHKYKPKKATKRPSETTDKQAGPSKRKATSTSSTQPETMQVPNPDVQEDTLPSSSSSDSELPIGLLN